MRIVMSLRMTYCGIFNIPSIICIPRVTYKSDISFAMHHQGKTKNTQHYLLTHAIPLRPLTLQINLALYIDTLQHVITYIYGNIYNYIYIYYSIYIYMCVQCISICVYIYIIISAWMHTAISKCHSFNVKEQLQRHDVPRGSSRCSSRCTSCLVARSQENHMEKPRKSVILPVNSKPWVF